MVSLDGEITGDFYFLLCNLLFNIQKNDLFYN